MNIIKDKNTVEIKLVGQYIKLEDVTRESASMIKNTWETTGKYTTKLVMSPVNTEGAEKDYSVSALSINGIDIIDPNSVEIEGISTSNEDRLKTSIGNTEWKKSPLDTTYVHHNDEPRTTVMYSGEETPLYRLYYVDEKGKKYYYNADQYSNDAYVADKHTMEELKDSNSFLKRYSVERVN